MLFERSISSNSSLVRNLGVAQGSFNGPLLFLQKKLEITLGKYVLRRTYDVEGVIYLLL